MKCDPKQNAWTINGSKNSQSKMSQQHNHLNADMNHSVAVPKYSHDKFKILPKICAWYYKICIWLKMERFFYGSFMFNIPMRKFVAFISNCSKKCHKMRLSDIDFIELHFIACSVNGLKICKPWRVILKFRHEPIDQ